MEQEKLSELLESYRFYKGNKEAVVRAGNAGLGNDYMPSLSFEENIKREERVWNADLQTTILQKDLFFLCLYVLQNIVEGGENCAVNENSLFQKIKITAFSDNGLPDKIDYYYYAAFYLKYEDEETSLQFDIDHLRLIVDRKYVEKENEKMWFPINKNKKGEYDEMATASIDKILEKDITIEDVVEKLKKPAQQFLESFIAISEAKSEEKKDAENDEDSED